MCYGFDTQVAVTTQEFCDNQGKRPIEDIGIFRQERIDELNKKAKLRSLNAEDGYTEQNLKIGDAVLRHYEQRPSKLHPKWEGPFIIYHCNPNGSYKLRAPNGHPLKGTVNGDRLKKYQGNPRDLYFKDDVLESEGRMTKANRRSSMGAQN
ncbi:hypothetical protein MJO29_013774 [Puccinia striiformis f. sp. tritici]|nr:hypothetical protein MJO29_013774 [Puccinia striiformis f. sp. tritici]